MSLLPHHENPHRSDSLNLRQHGNEKPLSTSDATGFSVEVALNEREKLALDELCELKEMTPQGVMLAAFRLYQSVALGAAYVIWKSTGPVGCMGDDCPPKVPDQANTTDSNLAVACIRFVRRWWPPALHRELESYKKMQRDACEEWAEDHTHLQKLCREAGCTDDEVEGDSYGVPGISDLADLLQTKHKYENQGHPRPHS